MDEQLAERLYRTITASDTWAAGLEAFIRSALLTRITATGPTEEDPRLIAVLAMRGGDKGVSAADAEYRSLNPKERAELRVYVEHQLAAAGAEEMVSAAHTCELLGVDPLRLDPDTLALSAFRRLCGDALLQADLEVDDA